MDDGEKKKEYLVEFKWAFPLQNGKRHNTNLLKIK
jgi:hypothetical protein